MKSVKKTFWIFFLFTAFFPTQASQQVIIIGGGPTPLESQASIELNTRWIIDIIEQTTPGSISQILYTDGNNPGIDAHKLKPIENEIKSLQVLARVYGKEIINNYQFYSSNISSTVIPSSKKQVTETLRNAFLNLKPADKLLLIYQGHGGHNKDDTNGNYLRLWGDTKLTVNELESLMREAHPESTILFVFPQCFSGAFARLVYKDAQFKNGLANGMRCGFLSQNDYQGSEGCTASVYTDTYRDYSSYFFSAIYGKTIDGQPLDQKVDHNYDGKITLAEAHIYSLANAFSVDYSRSTSEDYLEQWTPWYLPWLPYTIKTDNTYNHLAHRIAARFNISGNKKDVVLSAIKQLKASEKIIKDNESKLKQIKRTIKIIQLNIQKELVMNWPQLNTPYTREYRQSITKDINKIQLFILKHNDYVSLVDKQERQHKLTTKILDSRRKATQMRKIFHFIRMGKILDQFNHYATNKEKSAYEQLLGCENSTL